MKSFLLVRGTPVWILLLVTPVISLLAQTNFQCVTRLTGTFGPIAISGNYLFMAGWSFGTTPALRILEISDPAHPVDLGYQDGGGTLSGVCVLGSYAYVSSAAAATTRILNISNPTNPVVVGHIEGQWQNGMVDGHIGYFGGSTLGIFDVSNPASPMLIGQTAVPNGYSGLFARDNYVYVIHLRGLAVYDASNPTTPVQVGGCQIPGSLNAYGISGKYACMTYTNGLTDGFCIADIACPTNPVIVYQEISLPALANALAISGNYVYVGVHEGVYGGGQPVLWVYDFSNPTKAVMVLRQWLTTSWGFGESMAISKGYLYSSGRGQLNIYSLGRPSAPSLTLTPSMPTNLVLSWPTPSLEFAVQQNLDLSPTNWLTLPNTPVVVGGWNQVTIRKPDGSRFYRLLSQ